MNNGSVQQAICKDVIGVTIFSNSDLGPYIKILKWNIMCKGGSLASHFYLIREIKKCLMDFENVNGFSKLWKKVLSMNNNLSY